MPASFIKPRTVRTTARSGSQHLPRAGASGVASVAPIADPPASPMFGGSALASPATCGGSPLVASTAARYAAGGTAPGIAGVGVPGAKTAVEVVRGSASTAGGVVEVATQAPGPVGMHLAGPGVSRKGWRRIPSAVLAAVGILASLIGLAVLMAAFAGEGWRLSVLLVALLLAWTGGQFVYPLAFPPKRRRSARWSG